VHWPNDLIALRRILENALGGFEDECVPLWVWQVLPEVKVEQADAVEASFALKREADEDVGGNVKRIKTEPVDG
jgi:hypothetical protein